MSAADARGHTQLFLGALRVWRCKVFLGLTTKLVKELRVSLLSALARDADTNEFEPSIRT